MDGHSVAHIRANNLTDDTLYIACRAYSRLIEYDELCETIVTSFTMEDMDTVYIFPVTCIKKSLNVVRNFGADDTLSFRHVLPQNKWPGIFKNLIKELMNKR